MASGNELGELVRRLRRRQRLTRRRLSDRVRRVSGDPAINPDRLREWELGRYVPDRYWRGWLAIALGVPRDSVDRAAAVADGRRRTRRRGQAADHRRAVASGSVAGGSV